MISKTHRGKARSLRIWLASALLALGAFCAWQQTALAGPGDWFSYTNETGDNDLNNLLNWRWSHDSGMSSAANPTAEADPVAWGNPTTLAQLHDSRKFVSAAGSGFSAAQGNVYTAATIGSGSTFALTDAQLDAGFTLTVTGTGVVTSATGFSANGLGLNVVRDMPTGLGGDGWGNTVRYYRPNGAAGLPSGNKNWFGNSLETTLHVVSGGTLNNSGGTSTGVNSGIGPIGHLGYDLDSKTGPITANVTGTYTMGGQSGNGTGGGWLQLRGYNASTAITMGTLTINPGRNANDVSPYADFSTGMTGSYGIFGISDGSATGPPNVVSGAYPGTPLAPNPAFYAAGGSYDGNQYLISIFNGDPNAYLLYDSKTAQLRVELTSQNAGGLFNPVAVTNLTMPNISTNVNYTNLPEFVLSLSGYTPVAGDLFSIVTSANPISGTGAFDLGWDTNFLLGGATWQLHNDNPNLGGDQPGIYLEVITAGEAETVPEPSTLALAAFGLMGLGWLACRRVRRRS
ncbi:MAG: PEP-CTERM sorting domain-containing protein [Planctomycetes bacterium]|nr:PEP-CTERM sorting domain-containing protein [Planctomycetota bacterium]